MSEIVQYLYRCESEDGGERIYIHHFLVTKKTKRGVWIDFYSKAKWVSLFSRKRYAYPTVEMAAVNFEKRTRRMILILSTRIASAKNALSIPVKDYIPCFPNITTK